MRWRAAIDPEASTTNKIRCACRPVTTLSCRSSRVIRTGQAHAGWHGAVSRQLRDAAAVVSQLRECTHRAPLRALDCGGLRRQTSAARLSRHWFHPQAFPNPVPLNQSNPPDSHLLWMAAAVQQPKRLMCAPTHLLTPHSGAPGPALAVQMAYGVADAAAPVQPLPRYRPG